MKSRVEAGLPEKQGLKLAFGFILLACGFVVEAGLPEKQGLKRRYDISENIPRRS